MSRPSPSGRIVALKRAIPENRGIECAQRDSVLVVVRRRPRPRNATAPQDVVGDDEGPRRQPVDERLKIAKVFGLERVDEGQVERARESRVVGPNASSAGALTTVIRSSSIPASRHQPRARSVRARSGSIVTIVPSAGWPSAIHSVE